ncbi:MAG TPA: DoxX family protein [Stackebrandtia sp.]|uniref:DoxX family protein n=1 Tax=Stackebrandtia sp. TaxID=2023065 RepID=UPI002D631D98|nr:DoxX family protein [Stackebrandtia sp.]HZE37427.1 DoxX family protein [Stackebrandtia sp.]
MSTTDAPAPQTKRGLHITLWVVQALAAVFFIVASGGPKLLGDPTAAAVFHQIGWGDWYRYFVGVVEVAGGIGLLIPRLCGLASIGLAATMVGATLTNTFQTHTYSANITTGIFFVLFVLIAWGRWDRTTSLFTTNTTR